VVNEDHRGLSLPAGSQMSVARLAVLTMALGCVNCGGTPSPASPSPPPPAGPPPPMALSTGTPSVALLVASNAPGRFNYSLSFSISLPEQLYTRVVTVRRFELWLIGADGSVHGNRVLGEFQGDKFSGPGSSHTWAKSGGIPAPDDLNITRPPATTYRLSLEYTLDNETEAHVVTAESPVTSTVPPLPLMTGLTITSPVLPIPAGTRLRSRSRFRRRAPVGELPTSTSGALATSCCAIGVRTRDSCGTASSTACPRRARPSPFTNVVSAALLPKWCIK
jgi:hypothetical protein